MPRKTASNKKHIVSCRVSQDELNALQRRAQASGVNITMLLRRSLDLMEKDHKQTYHLSA